MKIEILDTGKRYVHLGTKERRGMRGNIEFCITRGAVGTMLPFQFYDDTGTYKLTGAQVWITLIKKGEKDAKLNALCYLTNTPTDGKGYFVFEGDTANLPAGEYRLKFKVVEPSGKIQYFPTDADYKRHWAKVTVLEAN